MNSLAVFRLASIVVLMTIVYSSRAQYENPFLAHERLLLGPNNPNESRVAWVRKCLADLQSIKQGLTRRDVEMRLDRAGGLSSPSRGTFVHRECVYFKVDVEFQFERDPNDMGRAKWSPDDKVVNVSRPYLAYGVTD